MSHLVTITSKFYDKSGHRLINLNVKSRYQGSTRDNLQKTDESGLFVFQASSNRTIEILAKPPNTSDYTVFKTINSSIASSVSNPIKVQLPKTLEEYQQGNVKKPENGLVSTLFKIVDSTGKVMVNFPLQSRPKGGKGYERSTNEKGTVEVQSSPNRDIEILVLTSNDQFVQKSALNSGNGSQQPILIKLDEPYANFKSTSTITLLDRDGSDYVVEKTNVEMLILDSGEQKVFSISNGKIPLRSMVGQRLQFTVLKPDGTALKSVLYMAKRVKESPVKLHLDVDVTNGTTAQNEPKISKPIKENVKCKTCGKSIDIDIDIDFIKDIAPQAKENFQNALLLLPTFMRKYEVNSCRDLVNILAQGQIETENFTKLREGLNYTKKTFKLPERIYSISPTAINAGFERRGMGKYTRQQKLDYIWDNLAGNDAAYGFHLYGNEKYPNRDYRGRGLLHMTHFSGYKDCAKSTGLDIVNKPTLLETNYNIAIETGVWFWKNKKNGEILILAASESIKINSDSITTSITHLVNGGEMKLAERKVAKKNIARKFISKNGTCK
ncbi:glycoside hydrolase family 19 protein [Acinetobacter kyonggiensis]|uniref:Predicted chitinase n=1 Tax=Acinetobacter kyonggiensis TaxID=595670 RepID=A0A1H3MIP1_9GAMM|nr:glycoside hydrolase family 19 protein [Acinetobacter kyonggiensis]SDY76572.1 Predicted chitinase [Acinetobacter kyonggiensis]